MKRKSAHIPIMIFLALLILSTATFMLYRYVNRSRFNEGILYGNSAGNFYNKGLFCEYNGLVYFSNPNDSYTLYTMNPQGTDVKKIGEDNVGSINVDENYIYYVRDNGSYQENFDFLKINTNSLCRINKNGRNQKILDSAPSLYASLSGNYLYYVHYDEKEASTLYKIKIDGTDQKKLDNSPLLLSPGEGGSLCYTNISHNRNIMYWDIATDTQTLQYEEDAYWPIVYGSYLYFLDCSNNYRLARIHRKSGEKEFITEERIDCYNVYGNYIYYQTNHPTAPALYRIPTEVLTQEELIATGIYCDINITSSYVYFRSFQAKDQFFQTPTNGAVNVTAFSTE